MENSCSKKSDAVPKRCYCPTHEEQRSDRSPQQCHVSPKPIWTARSPTPVSSLVPRSAKVNADDLREIAQFIRSTGPLESVKCEPMSQDEATPCEKSSRTLGWRRVNRTKKHPVQRNKPLAGFVASGPKLVPRVSSSGVHYIEITAPHLLPAQVTFRRPSADLYKARHSRKPSAENAGPPSKTKVKSMAAPAPGETLPQMTFSGYDSGLGDEAISTYISSLQLQNYSDLTNKEPYKSYEHKKKPNPGTEHSMSSTKPSVPKAGSRMAELRFGFEQNSPVSKSDWRGENSDKPLPSLPDNTCQNPLEHGPGRNSRNSTCLGAHPFAANINKRSLNTLSTFIPQDGLKSAHLRLNATLASQHGFQGTSTPDDMRSISSKPQSAVKPAPAIQQSFNERRANARARKLRDLERLRESINNIRQMPQDLHSPSIESEDPFTTNPRPAIRSSHTTNDMSSPQHGTNHPAIKQTRESVSMPSIEKLDLSPMPLMKERFPAPATTKPQYPYRKGAGTSSYRLTTTAPATPPPSRPVPPLPDDAHLQTSQSLLARSWSSNKPKSTLEQLSLEDRLQHSERENRLLEAALMAMLRTNGLLNGCICCSTSSTVNTGGGVVNLGHSRFSTASSNGNTFSSEKSSIHTRQVSEDTTVDSTGHHNKNNMMGRKLRSSQDTSASSVSSARTGNSSKALDTYFRTRNFGGVRTPTPPPTSAGGSNGDGSFGGDTSFATTSTTVDSAGETSRDGVATNGEQDHKIIVTEGTTNTVA